MALLSSSLHICAVLLLSQLGRSAPANNEISFAGLLAGGYLEIDDDSCGDKKADLQDYFNTAIKRIAPNTLDKLQTTQIKDIDTIWIKDNVGEDTYQTFFPWSPGDSRSELADQNDLQNLKATFQDIQNIGDVDSEWQITIVCDDGGSAFELRSGYWTDKRWFGRGWDAVARTMKGYPVHLGEAAAKDANGNPLHPCAIPLAASFTFPDGTVEADHFGSPELVSTIGMRDLRRQARIYVCKEFWNTNRNVDTRSINEIVTKGLAKTPFANYFDNISPPESRILRELIRVVGGSAPEPRDAVSAWAGQFAMHDTCEKFHDCVYNPKRLNNVMSCPRTHEIVATALYMSPEINDHGEKATSPASWIYGVLSRNTLRHPRGGPDGQEAQAIFNGELQRVSASGNS